MPSSTFPSRCRVRAFFDCKLEKPLVVKLQKISAIYRYALRFCSLLAAFFLSLLRFVFAFFSPSFQGDLIRLLALSATI